MTDIQAIKKAAEAAKPCGNTWYDSDHLIKLGLLTADAEMITHLPPATVLELCRLAEERTWQPIETAPKDGSVILVWRFYPCAVKWTGDSEYPWEAVHLDGVHALNRNGFQRDDRSITHWMPLPEPPK